MSNKVQGEGDYEAARRFNKDEQDFVKHKYRKRPSAGNAVTDYDEELNAAAAEGDADEDEADESKTLEIVGDDLDQEDLAGDELSSEDTVVRRGPSEVGRRDG